MGSEEIKDNEDVGSMPTFFQEHKRFMESLEHVVASIEKSQDLKSKKALINEMCATLELYQEQPTCFDPYLERIVSPLMSAIAQYLGQFHDSTNTSEFNVDISSMDPVFDLVYTLCKVRGYKVVLRFFPHSVADVEPVFTLLWWHSSMVAKSNWTTRYILLIWLSLLAMVPFDMESIDSGGPHLPPVAEINGNSLIERWVGMGKFYLCRSGCDMEGAAVMLARLLARKDTQSTLQPAFIEWAISEIKDTVDMASTATCERTKKGLSISGALRVNGALRALCHLFPAMENIAALGSGNVEQLLDVLGSDVFGQNAITRKLVAKTTQRLALLVLPLLSFKQQQQIASVKSSLRENLGDKENQKPADVNNQHQPESIEVSEEVETCIGILLHNLSDKDTIVRWSAAKGIGRVCERLPRTLAQEIVSAVLELLRDGTESSENGKIDVSMTSVHSWHGGLLCLAELSRRGQLKPEELEQLVPWVVRGLTYEIQRGDYSTGSNVRDAACYVMWSFARMPNSDARRVFNQMSKRMATALISVAIFDREPSVRRAASAAFQEHVGRQSEFPHGIAILQVADFFSVGNLRNAFVVASRKVLEFVEYQQPLLNHLCSITIYHWDNKVRELAAQALRGLAPLDASYVIEHLLAGIVNNVKSPLLAVRHGAIIAAGAIVESLPQQLQTAGKMDMILSVSDLVPGHYLHDFGASQTLSALAAYMGSVSRAHLNSRVLTTGVVDRQQQQYFDYFVQALTMCSKDPETIVKEFTSFVDAFGITDVMHQSIVRQAKESSENFVLALGALSGSQSGFELLCNLITEGMTVEVRRNGAQALGQICQCLQGGDESAMLKMRAVEALIEGLKDHTVDNRGDVGSWVRKQCLHTLLGIFTDGSLVLDNLLSSNVDLGMQLLGRVLNAATEKIDKLRIAAGELLERLVCDRHVNCDYNMHVKHIGRCILPSSLAQEQEQEQNKERGMRFSWNEVEAVYNRLVPVLSVTEPRLRQPLFEGMVVAGSTEPLGKYAVNAVATYAETLPEADTTVSTVNTVVDSAGQQQQQPSGQLEIGWSVDGIVEELTRLLQTDKRTSKLINPALIFTDRLIEQGVLVNASEQAWTGLYRAVQQVALRLRAPHRLLLCLKLYSSLGLVGSQATARMSARSLLSHTGHPMPKIRQAAADHLFAMLCVNGVELPGLGEKEDTVEQIELLLVETEWVQNSTSVKEARNRLATLMGMDDEKSHDV